MNRQKKVMKRIIVFIFMVFILFTALSWLMYLGVWNPSTDIGTWENLTWTAIETWLNMSWSVLSWWGLTWKIMTWKVDTWNK